VPGVPKIWQVMPMSGSIATNAPFEEIVKLVVFSAEFWPATHAADNEASSRTSMPIDSIFCLCVPSFSPDVPAEM